MSISKPETGKEPWLAVNLSAFFPGVGQIYSGQYIRGWLWIISQIILQLATLLFCILPSGDIEIGLSLFLLSILVTIGSLFDAHRCTNRRNTESFTNSRKSEKDPWLAVFLSRLLLGLGHLYIDKWLIGIALITFTFSLIVFPSL